METNKDVLKNEQIKRRDEIRRTMRNGDLITAAEILGKTTDAFRARLNRCKEDAMETMEKVIENRNQLVKKSNTNNNESTY
jgi:hypothetical protein